MKGKRFGLSDRAAVWISLGLLLAAGLYTLLWPHGDFSGAERRYLNAAPAAPSLAEWKTDKQTEEWLRDRVPFRTELVAADAVANAATGRRTQLGAWPVGGAIVEKPVKAPANGRAETAEKRLEQFGALADRLGVPWNAVVPRSHGWLLRGGMNSLLRAQYEPEQEIYGVLEGNVHFLDVLPEGSDPEKVYYRTDHHWTLDGAYLAYAAICGEDGLPVLPLEDFEVSRFEGFSGTTRSRSGLPVFRTDTLVCAEPAGPVTLTLEDGTVYDHLIFPEKAKTYDGYAVYLGGDYGMLEIRNDNAPGGTLLVFKDSFADCLLPLLSADYRRIVAVDARYYRGSFSDAAAAAGQVDRILCIYSPDSLVNDTQIAGKAGR